jgi:hypothetical protein
MHKVSGLSFIHDIVKSSTLKEMFISAICLLPYIHSDFDMLPCLRSTTNIKVFFYESNGENDKGKTPKVICIHIWACGDL